MMKAMRRLDLTIPEQSNARLWLLAGGYGIFLTPHPERRGMYRISRHDARSALRYW